MVLNSVNNNIVRAITLSSTVSCIYIPLCLLYMYYTDNIYNVGKFKCYPYILALAFAEYVKYYINYFSDVSKELKFTKVKRSSLKFELRQILKTILVLIGSVIVFYIIAVLFGAPVVAQYEETLMFSILISSLSILPSCLNLGVDGTVAILTGKRPNTLSDMLLRNLQMTLLGAWLAAVVIPLDWDRPWQVWPIPCCIGAILGYVAADLFIVLNYLLNFCKPCIKNNSKSYN